MNLCADAVNDGSVGGAVSDCTDQQADCNDVATTLSQDAEFQAKKRDVATTDIKNDLEGSESSSDALSSLESMLGIVSRGIKGLFDGP